MTNPAPAPAPAPAPNPAAVRAEARAARLAAAAERARGRAAERYTRAHGMSERIPYGQPIHGVADRNYRDRISNTFRAAQQAQTEAQDYARRARHHERRARDLAAAVVEGAAAEGVAIGDHVIARFTNSGRTLRFEGTIVGRTVNVWKVEAITSPYPGEDAAGRVFHIPAAGRPRHSANNCVVPYGAPRGAHDDHKEPRP